MKTKEDKIIRLFFEDPTREWHFEEILKEAGIARSKADRWLKRFVKEGLIRRIKEKGRMPFYISNHASLTYRNKKKMFALNNFYESGLLDHLGSLKKAKSVILFGSFSRSDWYRNSDIDLFIYGDPEGLKIADYELKLHKSIQLFVCKDKAELVKMGSGLMKSIIKGNIIKGNLDFIKVSVNA
ncbi:MAG: nucleotidyltransferase domain-containing protein [archaeon]